MGRAQVSVEYLMISAFAFLFAVPVIAMFYTQSHELNEGVSNSQAERLVSEIVDAANQVYYLGEPSKKTLTLYMPKNVQDVGIQGKTFSLTLTSTAGSYDVVKVSSANLTGSIGTFSGLHRIKIEAGLTSVSITE